MRYACLDKKEIKSNDNFLVIIHKNLPHRRLSCAAERRYFAAVFDDFVIYSAIASFKLFFYVVGLFYAVQNGKGAILFEIILFMREIALREVSNTPKNV